MEKIILKREDYGTTEIMKDKILELISLNLDANFGGSVTVDPYTRAAYGEVLVTVSTA